MGRPKLKLAISAAQRGELRDAFKANTDARQRDRLQAIQLASTGRHTHEEIAHLLGRARSTIQLWLDQYEAGGLARLLERKPAPGKSSELQRPEVQAQLQAGLKTGRWRTAAQIAAWLAQTHGIKRVAGSLYYWLGKIGGTLKVPRPAHTAQNPAAQAAFKAHLLEKLQALPVPAGKPVKVWVADECRMGLHTFTRRCWGLRGQRVVVPKQQCYEWEYVYGAVEVVAGETQFQFMPTVSLALSGGFLAQIAASDPAAEHVVIWDGAGFHPTSAATSLPARIHLLALPPYSPELNPVEGLWDQMKDCLCNRVFPTLDDLEGALSEALRPFWENKARALSLVFGWMHDQANAS
jgi:transposase